MNAIYKYSAESNDDATPSWVDFKNTLCDNLENLENSFKRQQNGLDKKEFFETIDNTLRLDIYSQYIIKLYHLITDTKTDRITWGQFLDFLIQNIASSNEQNTTLFQLANILTVPQTKREPIVKIVQIENDKYFCYVIISKHGKVGLYDGNLNFLISYQLIMTREDIYRKEEDRRRRNRWVTDAIFCQDTQMLIFTNTSRSIVIYEASGLKHEPLWIILTTPNIIQCMTYRCNNTKSSSSLFMADEFGAITSITFLQPKNLLLRKKHNDKINLFYWGELKNERDFLKIKEMGRPHQASVKNLIYISNHDILISCSQDDNASLLFKYLGNREPSNIFKFPKGCNCFILSQNSKILITGSPNGVIRIWNPIITSKPIGILESHKSSIIDIKMLNDDNLFVSSSADGMIILWDVHEQKCLQSFTINFPSFSIFGKQIEWGIESIYPGPKRTSNDKVWNRSSLLIACCNHIAVISVRKEESENDEDLAILSPPPLQNSVLVPKTWKTEEKIDITRESYENTAVKIDSQIIEQRLKELEFILKKNIFDDNRCHKSDINFKIASLESKKNEMRQHVARGAPYLALDLYEVKDVTLTPNLPIPNVKRTQRLVEKIEQLLSDASSRDVIFSEPSSSRSPRSSRSSYVEFD